MKHVVSISLGTSKRDKREETEFLGQRIFLERRGTDGDLAKYAELFRELDGKVDAIGVGGSDIYVVVGTRRYAFQQILKIVQQVKKTPVVDGSGLKHTLERTTIEKLSSEGILDLEGRKVLMVAAVDRYGMAQALEAVGANVTYGDLCFGVGIPIALHSYKQVEVLGRILLPIITRLPFKWFYPTGEKQETRTPKFGKMFAEAEVIAGDWHFIRRYAPDDLKGKTIITQTLRKSDLDWLKTTGLKQAITTTPIINGETFATNVMEAALVAIIGKKPEELTPSDYLEFLKANEWKPNVITFDEA